MFFKRLQNWQARLSRKNSIPFLILAALLVIVPVALSVVLGGSPRPATPEEQNDALQRQHWFYQQRAYPFAHIPDGARLHSLAQLNAMLRAQQNRSAAPGAILPPPAIVPSQTSWTLVGPAPITPYSGDYFSGTPSESGRITAIALDPRDATNKTIYLGGAEGGVWKTTDGGTTWTALTDSQPSLAVGSIAVDPTTNPSTVYVGTGEENLNGDAYFGAGVLKSTDGGSTWTQDSTFSQSSAGGYSASGPYIGALAVDPASNQILLAAVEAPFGSSISGGIWRSTNGGGTWTSTLSAQYAGEGTSVVYDPATPGVAYAALGGYVNVSGDGVYKSTDAGATWTALTIPGVTAANVGRITLAIGPPVSSGKPGELVVSIAAATPSTQLLGLYITTNGGSTWTQSTSVPDFCGGSSAGQCWYDMAVAVSPSNANDIYVGGSSDWGGDSLSLSTDGGATWSPDLYAGNSGTTFNAAGELHTDTHAIVFSSDGSQLFVGDDGGIWSTSNVNVSTNINWTGLNNSLSLAQFYPGVSIVPGNPNGGAGGTQDNSTLVYSGSADWQALPGCGDGAATAYASTTLLYYACAADQGIWSIDNSTNPPSYAWATSGIGTCTSTYSTSCYDADFVPPMAIDPENNQTLYFGTNLVYQTTNGATSWSAISSDLTGGTSGEYIDSLSVSPVNSNIVYASTTNPKLWISQNATAGASATFTEIDSGLPNRIITDVAADPVSSSTAYITYSGFTSCTSCDGLGHIYMTTNNGNTWTNITGNLPDTPVNAIVADPAVAQTLYAATDIGVFATGNGGATWSPLVTGLPRVAVVGLALDPSSRVLWAGTHGRSMWSLQLPQPPGASATPGNLSFSAIDVGATSSAQIVTLNNTGSSALTITSISASAGFSQTNNCGTSLAANSSCSINVAFSPTSAGTITGTLTITDNVRGGPQTVQLSGAAEDFAVTSSPASATVTAGNSATYQITVAPASGSFSSAVTLACAGLPSKAACAFSPASVTPGNASASSTLTVTTTATTTSSVPLAPAPPEHPDYPLFATWLAALFALALLAAWTGRTQRKSASRLAFSALAICALCAIASCAGTTKSGGNGGGTTVPGTPSGTYTITVTGSSASLQHSAPVTLVVQ